MLQRHQGKGTGHFSGEQDNVVGDAGPSLTGPHNAAALGHKDVLGGSRLEVIEAALERSQMVSGGLA